MKKKYLLFGALVVLVGIGAYFAFAGQKGMNDEVALGDEETATNESETNAGATDEVPQPEGEVLGETEQAFLGEKKAAHWESNTPLHEDLLPAAPVNVVIDFNFNLAASSSISIMRDGKEYGTGTTTIDANKIALRRTMDPTAPDGRYTVNYKACWPDGSCEDGLLQFEIDRTLADSYEDLRESKEVTITLADLSIEPAYLRISKGTTVVWQNDDEFSHFINTDGHPAHTYFPSQNSKELLTADSYRLTFNEPGYYPYHCSAHADDMQGVIVVE